MKPMIVAVTVLLLIATLSIPLIAQDQPSRPEQPPAPPRPLPEGARGTLSRGPEGALTYSTLPPELQRMELMRGYIDVVDRYTRLSRDPTSAGVAAVISAADILKARGADPAIAYFTKALETVQSEAVQRAIRLQLVELYKQSGQHDKALEQLTELINATPSGR